MRLESKKYLFDILQAARDLQRFSEGKTLSQYEADALLRSVIERQFASLAKRFVDSPRRTAAKVAEHERIISFSNILIHGYAEIDDRIVWDILQGKLPTLLRDVESLLDSDSD